MTRLVAAYGTTKTGMLSSNVRCLSIVMKTTTKKIIMHKKRTSAKKIVTSLNTT